MSLFSPQPHLPPDLPPAPPYFPFYSLSKIPLVHLFLSFLWFPRLYPLLGTSLTYIQTLEVRIYIWEKIRFPSSCVWVMPLNTMLSRLIRFPENVIYLLIYFFFLLSPQNSFSLPWVLWLFSQRRILEEQARLLAADSCCWMSQVQELCQLSDDDLAA